MTVTLACAAAQAVAVAWATLVLRVCAAAVASPPPQIVATAELTAWEDALAASTLVPELALATEVATAANQFNEWSVTSLNCVR
jgi:hypothetical protein